MVYTDNSHGYQNNNLLEHAMPWGSVRMSSFNQYEPGGMYTTNSHRLQVEHKLEMGMRVTTGISMQKLNQSLR